MAQARPRVRLTRVAFCPFDLGVTPTSEVHRNVEALGWVALGTLPWVTKIAGDDLRGYRAADGSEIVLAADGFGLLIRRCEHELDSLEDFTAIAEILAVRDSHHRAIREGTHSDVEAIGTLRQHAQSANWGEVARPEIWPSPPYTLSMIYLRAEPKELLANDGCLKGLSALLEPSQVRRATAGLPLGTGDLISSLSVADLQGRFPDRDMKSGCAAWCSWAGLVTADGHGTELSYFEALEIRLQFAWLRAHFVRAWAEKCTTQTSDSGELVKVATRVRPMLRKSRRIIDASASSRDQTLFDALAESSALSRELTAADEAVADIELAVLQQSERIRRRYDKTIESLLLLLAVFQAVPLIMVTPVVTLHAWWLLGLLGIFFLAVILRWRSP
jgi:hypothetical protein